MQLTKRDLNILKFINDMGFCEMPQICKKFGMRKSIGYRLMKRLLNANLVQHNRLFYGEHGVLHLTVKGAAYTDLPAIDKIPEGRYYHQITLTDVYIKLSQLYPDASWISERQLKYEKFNTGQLGKTGHISDGILVLPDDKKIAIEVELNMKSKSRIQKILKDYGTQLAIKEVWYFCDETICKNLLQQAKAPFIKVQSLSELFAK